MNLERSTTWTTFCQNIAVIVGILFAFFQYWNASIDSKKNASEQKVRIFYSSDLRDARYRIIDIFINYKAEINVNLNHFDDEIFADLIGDYQRARSDSKDPSFVDKDIITIADAIDDLLNCVEIHRCDAAIAETFVTESFSSFYCLTKGRIKVIRSDLNDQRIGRKLTMHFQKKSYNCSNL